MKPDQFQEEVHNWTVSCTLQETVWMIRLRPDIIFARGRSLGAIKIVSRGMREYLFIHTTGGYTLAWILIRFWPPSIRQSSIFTLPDLRARVGVADRWVRLAGWWRTPLRGSCCWRGMVIAAEASRAWLACWVATGGASDEKPRNGCEVLGGLFGSWGKTRALW